MRFVFSRHIRFCFVIAVLFICAGLHSGAAAQQGEDPCKELKTPKDISERYFNIANYKRDFPCLAKMIDAGKYKTSPKLLKDHMLPVLDHFFSNKLNEGTGYEPGGLLWRIMIGARDERGAKAVSEFAWSEPMKPAVSTALKRFYKPKGIKTNPAKATVKRKQEAAFSAMYVNSENIPLKSLSPSFSAELKPEGSGTSRVEGDRIIVTSLKGGNRSGNLVVSDKKRGLTTAVPLTFGGGMSIWWPLGGWAVTGGAAGIASATDEGTSTTFWVVSGVSAAVTTFIFYKFLRGEGLPFLSDSDAGRSGEELAVRFVPGPRSLVLNVRF